MQLSQKQPPRPQISGKGRKPTTTRKTTSSIQKEPEPEELASSEEDVFEYFDDADEDYNEDNADRVRKKQAKRSPKLNLGFSPKSSPNPRKKNILFSPTCVADGQGFISQLSGDSTASPSPFHKSLWSPELSVSEVLKGLSSVAGRGAPTLEDKKLYALLVQAANSKALKLVDFDKTTLGTDHDHLKSVDRAINDGFVVHFRSMFECSAAIAMSNRDAFSDGKPLLFSYTNTPTRCKDSTGSVLTHTEVLVLMMPADLEEVQETQEVKKLKKTLMKKRKYFTDGCVLRTSSIGGVPEFFCTNSGKSDNEVLHHTGIEKLYTFNGKTVRLRTSTFKLARSGSHQFMKGRVADSS